MERMYIFSEEDEPIEKIRTAWKNGAKGSTTNPHNGETMSESTFNFRADDYMLVSTRGSKYAHSANWTARDWSNRHSHTACGVKLSSFDESDLDHMTQKFVKGKPPCPRCISRLEFEAKWLLYYLKVYMEMVTALEDENE